MPSPSSHVSWVGSGRKQELLSRHLATRPGGFYLLDSHEVKLAMEKLEGALPGVRFFYAMKANSHPDVLRQVIAAGWNFDAASAQEIDTLISLGVPGSQILAANPVKDPVTISRIWEHGIAATVVDSVEEVHKIARLRRGVKKLGVLVRMALTDGEHSLRLSRKFGCFPEQIPSIVSAVESSGLRMLGIHFHVGTQCRQVELFDRAFEKAVALVKEAMSSMDHPPVIDMGGGFPVDTSGWENFDENDFFRQIGERVRWVQSLGISVWAEPGRYVCGRAGMLIVTIIGKVKRQSGWWLHLDNGIYGNFLTSFTDGQHYRFFALVSEDTSDLVPYTLCGPTCDGVDVIQDEVWLPSGLREGDRLVVPDLGAYSLETFTGFNGFSGPPVILFGNS